MKLQDKKIFITGGAGFIGANLVDRLVESNQITVYDNLTSGKENYLKKHLQKKNFELIVGDLLDLEKLKKSMEEHNFVFHLASNPDIAKSLENPSLDLKQGVLTTFNVLEAMRMKAIKEIAFTSGSGVYGDQGLRYTAEDFGPLLPVSMYGASKLAAEALISAFCHLYDMKAWIVRPANIVGRRQTHGVVYDFIKKLRKNPEKLEILGDGSQSKSYLYIDDFLDALFLVIEKSEEKVSLFNIASNTFSDVKTIARIVVEEMDLKNVKFEYTGGPKGWGGDVPKVRLDTKKINKLGWKAKLSSDEAIRKSTRDLLNSKF